MPVVSITLLPGYDQDTQHRMVNRVAQAVRSVIATPEAGTTVFIHEASTYRRDGKVFSGGRAPHPVASDCVVAFQSAMAQADMALAQSFLSSDFCVCLPGSMFMHSLQEFSRWTQQRFINIQKHCAQLEESWHGDNTVVFCHGILQGSWLTGEAFEGIRFIDRFEVKDGLITRQDVWTDLALQHLG